MFNFYLARERIEDFQAEADHSRQVKVAKQAGRPDSSLAPQFQRSSDPLPLQINPERRAELIRQEWHV
jgi:hypothetical protein